ncbi:ergothioneine biosynthesis protein EgtB [Robertkochia flava]|uniref:ergothioneine biosynthesis protein EgtB n=1 Tax=Robertkochia flava TaxID=3447986 RepID=UPI001CCBE53B|nr:ergothioneine biosynthesis protein EgtB [Robertkochia marina]
MIITTNIINEFLQTRQATDEICAPLKIEDYVVQPIVDVSPPKWHLGHTSWFFEEFILTKHKPGYEPYDKRYKYIFNSYYETAGEHILRTKRGNLTRPTVEEVYSYRDFITQQLTEFLEDHLNEELFDLMTIGIHHEKQHQELLISDIKYILGHNPLLPRYSQTFEEHDLEKQKQKWLRIDKGLYDIGYQGRDFCFDNELGVHKVYLAPYKISNKLVTNGEYLEFMEDGGYEKVDLWHAEGWDWIRREHIKAPLYWYWHKTRWKHYTLKGFKEIDPETPVTHISYYEAYAYAQWKGKRLPTEFEWEAGQEVFDWGKRWEWTESAYLPYPGFAKAAGPLGEYNGKFMVNQKVLRGASVATSRKHSRSTYRNFFHPHLRWQYTGIRLAQ